MEKTENNNIKKIENLAKELVNMSVKEVNELAVLLKVKYGINPVYTQSHVEAPSVGYQTNKVDEKTVFDVVLKKVGSTKLKVIKTLKDITGSTLTEAKNIVESTPKGVIKKSVNKDTAEVLKKKLEEVGAEIELI